MRNARTKRPNTGKSVTKSHFLDAAEKEFARSGYEGTKIRTIAEVSQANLGTLHYYWGSKAALFRAVCERRLRPINEERLRRFAECEAKARGGKPDVRALVKAGIEPALRVTGATAKERRTFRLFYGRVLMDPAPEVGRVMAEIFDPSSREFLRLMRHACPDLDKQEFYWRLSGYFGTVIYIQTNYRRVEHLSRGAFQADKIEDAIEVIAYFLAAQMMAPPYLKPGPTRPR
jgi:AcrR family transcriptional regulator